MKTSILSILLFISSHLMLAQNYIVINNDSTKITGDSIVLKSIQPYKNIKWEYRSGNRWLPFSIDSDSAIFLLDSSMVLRSISFDSLCRQRITDTVKIEIMKPVIMDGIDFTCDQKGGKFLLCDSVYLTIPDSALEILTNLHFKIHDSLNGHPFNYAMDNPERKFLFGFEFKGDRPIGKNAGLKIETSAIPGNQLLQIFIYDSAGQQWNLFNTSLLFNSKEGFLKTNAGYGEFAVFSLPLFREPFNNNKAYRNDNLHKLKSYSSDLSTGEQGEDPKENEDCKSGTIHASEGTADMSLGDCQVVVNETRIVYIDCGNTTGGVREQHIDKSCKPELYYKTGCKVIKIGQETDITFGIQIGKYPLENQVVSLQVPAGIEITKKSSERTNENGEITFTLKGTDEAFSAAVNFAAFVDYYLDSQFAYDDDQVEFNPGEKKQETITGEMAFSVISECSKPEDINCKTIQTPEECCENIINELPVLMHISPEYFLLYVGESAFASILTIGRNGEVETPDFSVISENPGIASGMKAGKDMVGIAGHNKGETSIILKWCDQEERIGVKVIEKTACDDAEVNIRPENITIEEGAASQLNIDFGEDPQFVPILSFSSTDDSYATVSDVGSINGVREGNTTINVSWCDGKYSKNIPLRIIKKSIECNAQSVSITPTTLIIRQGKSIPLNIEYKTLADGSIFIPLIKWRSSDEEIAIVNEYGVVTGVNPYVRWGHTYVWAKWCDDDSVQISVQVIPPDCNSDYRYSNCDGYLVSDFMYFKHNTASPAGTFYFSWDLSFRLIYEIDDGQVKRKFAQISGSAYSNLWNFTYLRHECDIDGITECLTHLDFSIELEELEPPEMSGSFKITCTYDEEPYSQTYKYNFIYRTYY